MRAVDIGHPVTWGSGNHRQLEARDQCGVAAVVGHPQAAHLVHWALLALQHRGQESAGIASLDETGQVHLHRGMGLVSEVFTAEHLARLAGRAAIGHVRYSTTGASTLENAQPILSRFRGRFLAVAHNGNLVNAAALREELEAGGAIFQTTTDTEVVAHLAARHGGPMEQAVAHALTRIAGGWALVFLHPGGVLAGRDPFGIRPLCLGFIPPSTWVAASETCALDALGAQVVREVEPGELVRLGPEGIQTVARVTAPAMRPAASRLPATASPAASFASVGPWPPAPEGDAVLTEAGLCAFEAIYLARPDSVLFGQSVHALRKEMGRRLAREHPAPADLVTGVPDSSLSAAMGYAEALGLPYEMGLVRNRYIGRTFIQPGQDRRQMAVQAKLNAVRKVIEGRRVVLVDDSIVRGTTSRRIVELLRQAGAREVHVRIASPPYRFPCFYGVDTARQEELIAARLPVDAVQEAIGADSLAYLSLEGLLEVLKGSSGQDRQYPGACVACFTGRYPVPPEFPRTRVPEEVRA